MAESVIVTIKFDEKTNLGEFDAELPSDVPAGVICSELHRHLIDSEKISYSKSGNVEFIKNGKVINPSLTLRENRVFDGMILNFKQI